MHSRMNDTLVTVNTVVTAACWTAAVALVALSFTPAVQVELRPPVCASAVILVAFGAVRWIAHMLGQLEQAQMNAFELGRDFQQGRDRLRGVK